MKNLFLLLILLSHSIVSYSCTCDLAYSFKKMIAESDFAVEGEFITNLSPNPEITEMRNTANFGLDILFKVTTIIKGELISDTIAIVQFDNGSCLETFFPGEKYRVVGNKVKNYQCIEDPESAKNSNDLAPTNTPPPLPSYLDEQETFHLSSCNTGELDYWKSISTKYLTIHTDLCSVYLLK